MSIYVPAMTINTLDIFIAVLWLVGGLLALWFLWELFKRLREKPQGWKGQTWRSGNGKTWDLPDKDSKDKK